MHGVVLRVLTDYIKRLFNYCCFWAISPEKDPSDPQSLRPIMLLPELRKVFERVIKKQMKAVTGAVSLHHENQFGFQKGKSTTQAIETLLNAINTLDNKYVAALSIDIRYAELLIICGGLPP